MSNEFIKELQSVTSEEQIQEFLEDLIIGLQLEYFLFAISFPLSIMKSDLFTIDNYPEGWRELYDKENIIQTDPIVKYCIKNHSPIFWGKHYSPNIKAINNLLFPTLQSGFTVPLHGPMGAVGIFSVSTSSDKRVCAQILSEAVTVIQIVTPYLQDAVIAIRDEKNTDKVQLTTREIECLTWATEGKSAWEISKILGCSERTITFHLNNATAKLKCTNRYQAIGKAILTGVITPSV